MHIKRIKVAGFKGLRLLDTELNGHLNTIVGDNETGKSTVLEATNLVLSCQVKGRNVVYDLDPYYFNCDMLKDYFAGVRDGSNPDPPSILIEAYLDDAGTNELARLKGTNNSRHEDCPGLYLAVELNDDLADDFMAYISSVQHGGLLPVEYFQVVWRSFADNPVSARSLPIKATTIDTGLFRWHWGPDRYLAEVISDCLDERQRIALSAAYRQLKQAFIDQPGIEAINKRLKERKGDITGKSITVSPDMSAHSTWDSSITAHLDDIPFGGVGKGEQSRVQTKLAIGAARETSVLLIEEPENHLSHSNMARLIDEISSSSEERQILIATHSSFVLNKLGIDNVKLLSRSGVMELKDLTPDTADYFMKLPGYDTLRLLLAQRTILVEGPSDELVIQKAYRKRHGKLPLSDGVDVISVGSLAFKRFLEIAAILDLRMCVVTDNDGDVGALEQKYGDYLAGQHPSIRICFDPDESHPSLEQQLLRANSLESLNAVLEKDFGDEAALLSFMKDNKTDCALKIFLTAESLEFPEYITRAI